MQLACGMVNFSLLDMLGAEFNRDPFFVDITKVLATHQLATRTEVEEPARAEERRLP